MTQRNFSVVFVTRTIRAFSLFRIILLTHFGTLCTKIASQITRMLNSLVSIRGIKDPKALMLSLLIWKRQSNYACLPICPVFVLFFLLHMRNFKASGTLIFQ